MSQHINAIYHFLSSNGLFVNQNPDEIKSVISALYNQLIRLDRPVLIQLRHYFNSEQIVDDSVFASVPFSTESDAEAVYEDCINASTDSIYLDNMIAKETSNMQTNDLATEVLQKVLMKAFAN